MRRRDGAAAVLVAAGVGVRFGGDVPKALVDLAGEPLVVHALRALQQAASVADVVVVASPEHLDRVREALSVPALRPVRVIAGGVERRDSVRLGLEALGGAAPVTAVHDAARPLASSTLVDRVVGALEPPWVAAAPGLPVVDTLKLVDQDGERVVRTVDRHGLWAVQTPQVFVTEVLVAAHDRIDRTVTDDLELVEAGGGRVRIVPGEARALKITYPDDLVIAGAWAAAVGGGR